MIQEKKLSEKEKFEMYNKISKKKLIEMLIESNRILENLSPKIYGKKNNL